MLKETTTSIDYKIIEGSGVLNIRELSVIRDKNQAVWQSKVPKKEIQILINFVPSRLSHIELQNNGTPQIEIICFEQNELLERQNQFTCFSKTKLFDPDIPHFQNNAISRKTLNLSENPLKPKMKYNAMEIRLSNPYHEIRPLNMGLTYFILFAKKEETIEKISPNIKNGNFFDISSLNNSAKKSETDNLRLSGISNNPFKKDRYSLLLKNSTALKKDLQTTPLSLTPPQKLESSINRERKTPEDRKFQEDLEKAIEESKRSSLRIIQEYLAPYSEDTRNFEEQLQRAMAESIDAYQRGNQREQRGDDDDGMEIEEDFSYEPDKKNIFEAYKNMIYEGEAFNASDRINENSMFALKEEHLAHSYLALEKNLTKKSE